MFVTEACREVANNAMQVMGGIGYTSVYPIERILRDICLSMIWVGTNEIMQYITQLEWYKEFEQEISKTDQRDSELDVSQADASAEKVFE
jgi:hypothetical protein